jgi:flavin reductase (DIM6/NTAB) family NADH-FMN oxidoreductase RutF
MISLPLEVAHRLLSPRVGYLIGSGGNDSPNIIPVSNVTSVSTSPELIAVGIYEKWAMAETVKRTGGFTLAVPSIDQLEFVWKLGASYSRYKGDGSGGKMLEFRDSLDQEWSDFGPVPVEAIGRMECKVTRLITDLGDHLWFVASVQRAEAASEFFGEDGLPRSAFHPVMQVVGNWMTTSATFTKIEFFD